MGQQQSVKKREKSERPIRGAKPTGQSAAPAPIPANVAPVPQQTAQHADDAAQSKVTRPDRRTTEKRPSVTGVNSDVFNFYDVDKKELGHGHYGVVRIATHKTSGEKFAMKTIRKAKVSRIETLRREIELMQAVDHPNIIKLYGVYEDERNLHLIEELCTGGELFDRIISRGHYSERDAAILVKKILSGVQHCHERGIVHRDLKPENFLFATSDENAELKIIDFGLSRAITTEQEFMSTRVGTPYYIAPEVLRRHYDKSCDLWSIGVITYILLCGYPPFYGDSDPEIFARVKAGVYDFNTPEWKEVSNLAKDFIKGLLVMVPSQRMTAAEALSHEWMKNINQLEQNPILGNTYVLSLKRFTAMNKLKKKAMAVIASQLTEAEIKELRDAFKSIDKDGNGVLTVEELATALEDMGYGNMEEEIEGMMKGIDIDGNGTIDYNEFIAATMQKNMAIRQHNLQMAFDNFAATSKNQITMSDLKRIMGSEEHALEVMRSVDTNNDGVISFEEFVAMMEEFGVESGSGTPPARAAKEQGNKTYM